MTPCNDFPLSPSSVHIVMPLHSCKKPIIEHKLFGLDAINLHRKETKSVSVQLCLTIPLDCQMPLAFKKPTEGNKVSRRNIGVLSQQQHISMLAKGCL